MKDKQFIRKRYKDVSKLIFLYEQFPTNMENGRSNSHLEPSICSESIQSYGSTNTITSQFSKSDVNQLSTSKSGSFKPKKKSLFRKLSLTFSRSTSSLNEKTTSDNKDSQNSDDKKVNDCKEDVDNKKSDDVIYSIPWELTRTKINSLPRSNSNSSEDDDIIVVTKL
uniref:Uncharacterized protein n=1 Tax=Parastrongyloides trichosuri TaxID=131310 RepID=A0A0N5A2B8_PARTI